MLQLLTRRLDATAGEGRWWSAPEWNRRKSHASLWDVRRVIWAARAEFSDFLRAQDESREFEREPENLSTSAA